jgi:hypothetical protein
MINVDELAKKAYPKSHWPDDDQRTERQEGYKDGFIEANELRWLSMDSAPMDGTEILVHDLELGTTLAAWCEEQYNYPNSKPMFGWCVPYSDQDEQGGCQTVNPVAWMVKPIFTGIPSK